MHQIPAYRKVKKHKKLRKDTCQSRLIQRPLSLYWSACTVCRATSSFCRALTTGRSAKSASLCVMTGVSSPLGNSMAPASVPMRIFRQKRNLFGDFCKTFRALFFCCLQEFTSQISVPQNLLFQPEINADTKTGDTNRGSVSGCSSLAELHRLFNTSLTLRMLYVFENLFSNA